VSATRTRAFDEPVPAAVTGDPLAPVRLALVEAARRDVAAVLARADRDAAQEVAAARAEADTVLRAARAEGQAEAASVAAAEHARVRLEARAEVLAAQSAAYDALRSTVHSRVVALLDEAGFEPVRARFEEQARAELGSGATIAQGSDGILVAELGDRRITLDLRAVADRALEDLGDEVEGLWRR
jgi:vacuolar-type H+-ATPase subunit E/Vma4